MYISSFKARFYDAKLKILLCKVHQIQATDINIDV